MRSPQNNKPTLPTLSCLSNEATGDERIDALLREDRELKRRREEIKAELEALGEDAKDRWYHQEYEREFAENARKAERQRQLRAKDEERKHRVNDRRANMTPEARAKWESLIADVTESTKEELNEESKLAWRQRKREMRELHNSRVGKANGRGA